MTKRALITGITGQDGAYLAKFLLDKGYEVYGTYRRLSTPNFWRLEYLGIFDKVNLIPLELSDTGSIVEALKISEPDEVYHLAAQSFVEASFETPVATGDITGLATTRILEAIRQVCPDVRFYNAATSEMFGKTGLLNGGKPLNENDIFMPMSPYAAAKLYSYWITKIYREGYKIFAVNGILEAMTCGKPVVASNVTEVPQVVKHGINGFLVPPRDSVAIARAILEIYDKNLIEAMGRESRKIAEEYDWKKIARIVVETYERL
jgi:GDPmannose 4,6-dehydratase